MRAIWVLVVVLGCVGPTTSSLEIAATVPSITTNAPTYTPGASITVSWSQLPGNAHDWVAIAPSGSAPTSVVQWVYTAGAVDGSSNFAVSTPGSYEARAFADDSYQLLASSPFDVAATGGVSTTQTTYQVGAPIVVSWSALPGNLQDWIALAPAGSAPSTIIRYVYTNGAASGTHTFTGLPEGTYAARAFLDNSYTLLSEFAFEVAGGTVTRDRAAYAAGAPITITWSGLPGTPTDWIGLAPEGASVTTVTAWAYTGGATSGNHVFTLPASGRYVARAFTNDSYVLAAESLPFLNGVSISTDAGSYAQNAPVTVTWSQLPGNNHDWIAIAPVGSPATTVTGWAYTNGAASGSRVFTPANGTYVARAFVDDTYDLLVESSAFVVGTSAVPTVSVAKSTIGWGQSVMVSWSNFPTNVKDWIAIAPAGSEFPTITSYIYTNGASSGSYAFADGVPSAGSYVVRGFRNDAYDLIVEGAAFIAQESCVPMGTGTPQPGDPDFTGIGNLQPVSINTLQPNESRRLLCLEEASTLQVTGSGLAVLAAPRLRRLTGDLNLGRTASVLLPRLAVVGGDVILTEMPLFEVTLPALTAARGISARVRSLSMPVLSTLQGPIDVRLDGLDLGLLALLPNNVQIIPENPAIVRSIAAQELLQITGNVTIIAHSPMDFPKLNRIDGEATFRVRDIVLPSLTYVFSLYVTGTFGLQPAVRSLLLTNLTRVENIFQVQSNPELPQCQVDAILARLNPAPNLTTVGDNTGTGTCP